MLTILHFNDVYHIEPRTKEPLAGAARFLTALNECRKSANMRVDGSKDRTLTLFSGDVFNPSIMSSVTKGKHMVPILNSFGVDVACFGNHDFDFGVDMLIKLTEQVPFPWLLSNVLIGKSGKPLANGMESVVVERNGLKIGLMGLVEKEWLETLPVLPPDSKYLDFVEVAKRLATKLRDEGADLVIALTHMREPNDLELAKQVPELDLVLGGHDHFDSIHLCNGVIVVKSGTDFRNLSTIKLSRRTKEELDVAQPDHSETAYGSAVGVSFKINGSRFSSEITCLEITAGYKEDPALKIVVDDLCKDVMSKMKKVVGATDEAWECTVEANRTRESNVGSFLADIIKAEYETDIGLLCGGAIRSDDVYGPGDITIGDILNILPFEDLCVVLRVSGEQLLKILENGVSMVPKHEGRFPQVAGVGFIYDPDGEPFSRVRKVWIGTDFKNSVPLDLKASYTLATRGYMASGKDGYDELAKAEIVRDEENCHLMSTLLRRFFIKLKVVNAFKHKDHITRIAANIFKSHSSSSNHLALDNEVGNESKDELVHSLSAHYEPPKQSFSDKKISSLRVSPKVQGRVLTLKDAREKKMIE